jgi:hypothetical protein
MLTDLLAVLPDRLYRWLLARLGLAEGVHSMCPGWCPCGVGEHE